MSEHIGHLQGCTIQWQAEMAELCVRAEVWIKPGVDELTGFPPTLQVGCSTRVSIGQEVWDGTSSELTASATGVLDSFGITGLTGSGVDKVRLASATGWVQAAEVLVSSQGATCVVPACGETAEPRGHSWVGIGENVRLSARKAGHYHKLPREDPVRETEAVGLIAAP